MTGDRVLSLFKVRHVGVGRLRLCQEGRFPGGSCLALKRVIAATCATIVATLTSASTPRKGRGRRRHPPECGVSTTTFSILLEGASFLLASQRFLQFRVDPKLFGHLSTVKRLWRTYVENVQKRRVLNER